MFSKKNEKSIVLIIRYSLPILILFVTVLITIFISYEHEKNIKIEKEYIKKQYISDQKDIIKNDLTKLYNEILTKNNNIILNLNEELEEKVRNIHSITKSIYENNINIKSKKEILEQIKYAIKNVRFSNGKGYFFMYTMEGDVVLNPVFPKLEGKNLWNFRDSKGTLLLQEMNKILKNNDETSYSWYWKDPTKDKFKEYLKMGYFKKFEPLNIFIGTGFYLDDYLEKLKSNIIKDISTQRFKDGRYVFIVDKNGDIIANKHKYLLGKNINSSNELKYLSNFVSELRKENINGSYFSYTLKPNINEEAIHKTSYLLEFKDWGWVLGTGFTLESIKKVIKEKQNFLDKKYKEYLYNVYTLGFIFMCIVLFISYIISKYIEKSFFNYTSSLKDKQDLLLKSQEVALIGDWQLDVSTMKANWSDSILKIFGLNERPKSLGPEYLKKVMHKDDWSCFENSINNAIKEEKEHACIYRIFRPDGKTIWIDCKGEYDKSSNKIIGMIQDITARKEFELDKEKKDKLLYQQSKMAAMGEMIGNIAHQWRQPLSVISTASTGIKLKKEMNLLSDDDLIETMDNINTSTQYLSQTIEDFRNFFSPSAKSLIEVSLLEVFEKTLNLVNAQFSSKNIEIIQEIEDIKFKTLKNELIQVLVNILNNAKDALVLCEQDEKKYIFIKAFKENSFLTIEIYDSGKGIKEDVISRVFEPYFSTKHKGQGTGIGLYMSQEIVFKLLHGEIFAENYEFEYKNKKYMGAKFTVKIKVD